MKKLKTWIEEKLENISELPSPYGEGPFNEGKKIGFEIVLAEIKKMENSTPKNMGKFLDDSMKEYKMYEKSFERPKNYFTLDLREQWIIDAKLGILDWKGDDLTKKELKRFHDYYDKN